MVRQLASAIFILLIVCVSVSAQESLAFSRADTLRGMLSPLRTNYDVLFYHLEIEVSLKDRAIKGTTIMRFKAINTLNRLQVDLYRNMSIQKILHANKELLFFREEDAVFVDFTAQINSGQVEELKIFFQGIPQTPNLDIPMHGGFLWIDDQENEPWLQVVCQGSGASLWWPNKDHLSDEPDSAKIWVTIPADLENISNGILDRKTILPNEKVRYEWRVSYPINNYNITMNVGKFMHERQYLIRDQDTLQLSYHVKPYHKHFLQVLDGEVRKMLSVYEQYFGRYPFSKDGFSIIESIYPMEHQSAVCVGGLSDLQNEQFLHLLWHETAHEWWGNHVSCQDMADLWIHESFATYAEALMIEAQDGYDASLEYVNGLQYNVRHERPITGHYNVNDIFYQTEDLYSKGCLMLNTFRHVLNNDKVWFELLRSIQQRFAFQTITAPQLINFINEFTQTDYSYFFEQYLQHKTLPVLELNLRQVSSSLWLEYRWVSPVKNFRMPLSFEAEDRKTTFIYPTASWQKTILKDTDLYGFEINEHQFFFELRQKIIE
jgi:aminopeptidase N